MSYEAVMEKVRNVPEARLEELSDYVDALVDRCSKTASSVEAYYRLRSFAMSVPHGTDVDAIVAL